MVRKYLAALFLIAAVCAPAARAQSVSQTNAEIRALQSRLQERFQLLPIANGIVLTPKFKTTVRSVEVSDRSIALDGMPATGAELRDKLGADADLIFQVSYLDPGLRRALLGMGAVAAPDSATAPPAVSEPAPPAPSQTSPSRPRRRDDIVRIGGSVTIESDEVVAGDVAVIGGSARIDGEVDGEVAVIGGSLTLGPTADIKRDVTVVGGSLNKDPKAVIEGKISEVGMGDTFRGPQIRDGMARARWWRNWGWSPFLGFAGTLIRVVLIMLLAGIVVLIALGPVQQIADRAAAEPVKAWAVGFLVEILFVPVLVLTVVVLAVSIIGIPLLLLVPVAVVGLMVVCLVGFTGVAYHLGRLLQDKLEAIRNRPYLTTLAGIGAIVSPLIAARLFGLIGLGFLGGILIAAGLIVEYLAWTTGLGAATLVQLQRRRTPAVSVPPPIVPEPSA